MRLTHELLPMLQQRYGLAQVGCRATWAYEYCACTPACIPKVATAMPLATISPQLKEPPGWSAAVTLCLSLQDASRLAFGGGSFAGVTALLAATTLPHVFGSILVESPSLWVGEGRFLGVSGVV
eukprot:GHRQ01015285.1.p6 GENE.GHRQ01015285.1~~GHRQ01015285.1.p6  ORF type:complete len:124 (+),score=40.93 GHRQ01015285.1:550-921(+)